MVEDSDVFVCREHVECMLSGNSVPPRSRVRDSYWPSFLLHLQLTNHRRYQLLRLRLSPIPATSPMSSTRRATGHVEIRLRHTFFCFLLPLYNDVMDIDEHLLDITSLGESGLFVANRFFTSNHHLIDLHEQARGTTPAFAHSRSYSTNH
jgi:hypothetical protein